MGMVTMERGRGRDRVEGMVGGGEVVEAETEAGVGEGETSSCLIKVDGCWRMESWELLTWIREETCGCQKAELESSGSIEYVTAKQGSEVATAIA